MEGYPWVAEAEGEPIEGPYMICYKQYHKRQSDAILADPTRATGFAQHPTVTGGNPIVRPSKILHPGQDRILTARCCRAERVDGAGAVGGRLS